MNMYGRDCLPSESYMANANNLVSYTQYETYAHETQYTNRHSEEKIYTKTAEIIKNDVRARGDESKGGKRTQASISNHLII